MAAKYTFANDRAAATQFDQMIVDTEPDMVIDSSHHIYIIHTMELGGDVISEKPMTVDVPKMQAIYDAIQRTSKSLRVTFNYRYPRLISASAN